MTLSELLAVTPISYWDICIHAWMIWVLAVEVKKNGSKEHLKITVPIANLLNNVRPHPDLEPDGKFPYISPHVHSKLTGIHLDPPEKTSKWHRKD